MSIFPKVCRICGNAEGNQQYQVKEMMYGMNEVFAYFQCQKCGCLQISEIPADISKYYLNGYYSFSKKPPGSYVEVMWNLRNRFAITGKGLIGRLLYIWKPVPAFKMLSGLLLNPDARILDVGCGSGSLLRSMQIMGFTDLQGVDPFISTEIDYGNGLKILKQSLNEIDSYWDLIMFHHSFEHVPNPLESLRMARNLLNEGGWCLIRIPISASFAWRHYGVNWVQLDAPRHFYLHSLRSMEILAEKAGFVVEKIVFDSDAFQFWGSELYAAGKTYLSAKHGCSGTIRNMLYSWKARKLNRVGDGDQAAFFLKKV